MAVYIRLADSENVSPIIVGSAVDPSRMNWTGDGTNYTNQTGNYTRGTNLLSWLNTNSATFNAFVNNTLRTNGTGTFTQDFLVYDSTVVKLHFKITATAGEWEYEFSLTGNGLSRIISDRRFTDIRIADVNTIVNDELGNYGLFFICNPHVQQTPANLGIIWTWNSDWNTRYSPDSRFRNNIFFPLFTYGNRTNYQTYIRALFYNSGQSTGPDSTEDGGWGNFDDETETIGLPGVPSISALDTGFVRMYNPTAQELQQFASFIWSTNFFTNVIKNFSDPMQAIVSLAISPVAPTVAQEETNIVVGNLPAFTEQEDTITPIMAAPLTSQYVTVNCGSISLNEYWGSALDYSPYSKCEIYLPYIGVQNLSIDDVMGSTLTLQYNVDLLTGICTAVLKCVKSQHMDFDAALYHWSGNMMSNLPISGSNFAQVITALTSSIVSAGIPIVTGAGGAAIASGVVGGVMNMMNAKAQVQKSGSISMQSGALDNQTPYLILTRPIQSKAANYPSYKGWTTNITAEIGSLSGYTEIEYVHVEVAGATDEERNEIERLLKEGVII